MRLKKLSYGQYPGSSNAWEFRNLNLGEMNLIVSKNAIGKTRVLNVISGLAKLVSGEKEARYVSGRWNLVTVEAVI